MDEDGLVDGANVDTESAAPILPTTRAGARQRPALGGGRIASVGTEQTEYDRYRDEEDGVGLGRPMGDAVPVAPKLHQRGESEDGQMELDRRISNSNLKG